MKRQWIIGALIAVVVTRGVCIAAEQKWQFETAAVNALSVDFGSGALELTATQSPKISIESVKGYDPQICEVSAETQGGKFVFSVETKEQGGHRWLGHRKHCEAHFKIFAPAATQLRVTSGAGHVAVTGFSAGMVLDSGAGAVKLSKVSGPVSIKSGAGQVKGDLYSEDVKINSGVGNVDLVWNKIPLQGRAKFDAGVGNVNLAFPAGTKVDTVYRGGVGRYKNELEESPTGFRITASVGVGGLHIKKIAL